MRRQLIVGAAAVTATLLIAFVIPLAFAVQRLAANRPLNEAEQVARSLATAVALAADESVVEETVTAAQAGTAAALTVFLDDGRRIGAPAEADEQVERAFAGAAFAADAAGGRQVLVPTRTAQGGTAVVRAMVGDALLRQGVRQSWLLLFGLALGLLVVIVAVADRLARSVVGPARHTAQTARQLAAGDLTARASVEGPPEITEVAGALNHLAGRITALLAAERELVADMSHRLRTPLTALRLNAEGLPDGGDRRRLLADVDALEATVTELIREAREPRRGPGDEIVDLVTVTRERAEYWGALADDQGRPWALHCENGSAPVRLRRKDVETIVDILLDNVFTHTPDRTPYAVRVGPGRLVVEDDGPGLPDGAVRGRGVSGAGSTGLGLDIVRQIAEGAGGEVDVGEGAGGRVEVRLPPPASPG